MTCIDIFEVLQKWCYANEDLTFINNEAYACETRKAVEKKSKASCKLCSVLIYVYPLPNKSESIIWNSLK